MTDRTSMVGVVQGPTQSRRSLLVPIALGIAMAVTLACSTASQAAAFGENFGVTSGSFYAGTCELPPVTGFESSPDEAREKRDCHENSTIDPQTAVPVTQAGAHPDGTTAFTFNPTSLPPGAPYPDGNVRDIIVDLPAGFVGNPTATPTCPQAMWVLSECPVDTQVGTVELRLSGITSTTEFSTEHNPQECGSFFPFTPVGVLPQFSYPGGEPRCVFPIINLAPAVGETADFGFNFYTGINVGLEPIVRSDGDYGLQLRLSNVPEAPGLSLSTATLWGVPSAASHEGFRFNDTSAFNEVVPPQPWPSSSPTKPFLTNPTRCSGEELETKLYVDSWQDPGSKLSDGSPNLADPAWHTYVSKAPPITGCNKVPFEPSLRLRPTVNSAESPTGLSATLELPQKGQQEPNRLGTANLKDTTVKLPEGLSLTPAAANGLAGCSSAQIGLLTSSGAMPNPIRFDKSFPTQCPDSSKIGMASIETPLLSEPIDGSIYLASQKDNPFGSNFAVYLVAHSTARNLTIKLAGEVQAASDGRLVTMFRDNPQVPFSKLSLTFKGGPQAPLVTPSACGKRTTTTEFTSWAEPNQPVTAEDQFLVERGANGTSCVSSEGQLPNKATFEAGTVSASAGTYSPFVLKLSRADGTQRLRSINVALPKGLTGKLAGIPYCSDTSLAAAEHKTGKEEQSEASCPTASQVGTATVGAGAGPEPLFVEGKAYLSGPYKGAPLSLAIITPAVAGPFDLGTVVVRSALFVDPETAQITAKSDALPTVLEGVPLDIRSVVLRADRSQFTLNPTNCDPQTLGAEAVSTSGQTDSLASRFQVGNCSALAFKPSLKLSLKGSTKRVGHPALKAVVTYPKQGAYANISRAQVNLPHSEFLDQGNLNKTCTRPVLLAGNCPAKSVYGKVKAWTPLLEKPLEGNVYLVGGYGYKLPALVADLNGQIRVVLKGKVDSGPNKGIRNTFEAVPDAPVSRFVLEMKGGKKYSLLENSEDLCKKAQHAIVRFTGQNGAVLQTKPVIANQCGKRGKGGGKSK